MVPLTQKAAFRNTHMGRRGKKKGGFSPFRIREDPNPLPPKSSLFDNKSFISHHHNKGNRLSSCHEPPKTHVHHSGSKTLPSIALPLCFISTQAQQAVAKPSITEETISFTYIHGAAHSSATLHSPSPPPWGHFCAKSTALSPHCFFRRPFTLIVWHHYT